MAEDALRDTVPTEDSVRAAVAAEMAAAELLPDNAFKAPLAGRLAAEVLIRLAEEER